SMTSSTGASAPTLIISTTWFGSAVDRSGTCPAASPVVHLVWNSPQLNVSIVMSTSGCAASNSDAIRSMYSARGPCVKLCQKTTSPLSSPSPADESEGGVCAAQD